MLDPYLRERYRPFDVRASAYEETLFRNAYLSYEAMRGHLCGPDRRGDIEVEENDEKIVIAFDPCGSGRPPAARRPDRGHRLARRRRPTTSGSRKERHDWAWNEQGVCYYCAHCCFALELWPAEQWGHPVRVVDSPLYGEAQGPEPKKCTWTIYKTARGDSRRGVRADREEKPRMSWSAGAGLEGKGVVVTGAAGGIGREVATAVRRGRRPRLRGRPEGGRRWRSSCRRSTAGRTARRPSTCATCRPRRRSCAEPRRSSAVSTCSRTSPQSSSAATTIDEVTEEDWDFQHDVNLKAGFFLNRAAARLMREQGSGGRMINFTSQGWWTGGFGGSVVYSATRAESSRCREGSRAPTRRTRSPSTRSPRAQSTRRCCAAGSPTSSSRRSIDRIPLGYMAEPGDLAGTVVFLASDHARYITGATINVSGGWLMY